MRWKRFFGLEWDSIAGLLSAVTATILSVLGVVPEEITKPIILLLLALLFMRDLRRETKNERIIELIEHTAASVKNIQSALSAPDAELIGPHQLRAEMERFSREASGELIFFNVCLLMYKPQPLFDIMLRRIIENPTVASLLFILDEREQEFWQGEMVPKLAVCPGSKKVKEPRWCKMQESISFILAETHSERTTEALLSFWGEPFMARTTHRDVPRYIFRVRGHSELIARFTELERSYRFHT